MSEVPILCSNCLGSDGQLRMVKQPDGEECKICTRPFTVFRWQLNDGSKRANKTLVCKTCAKVRNCCQSCMLDINVLIPFDIRDTALKMAGLEHLIPESLNSRNAEVKAIMADKQQSKLDKLANSIQDNEKAREILQKLAQGLHGAETKGPSKTSTKSISSKKALDSQTTIPANLSKLIKALPFNGSIQIPNNEITSFFFFGIVDELPQYVISEYFEQFGKIKSITVIHRSKCGFVSYTSRKSAEKLAESVQLNGLNSKSSKSPGMVILNNSVPIRIAWGEVKPLGTSGADHQKLALVVNKVMLQLAEKDHKSSKSIEASQSHTSNTKSSKSSKTKGESSKAKPSKLAAKTKYKTSAADFEL